MTSIKSSPKYVHKGPYIKHVCPTAPAGRVIYGSSTDREGGCVDFAFLLYE